MAGYRSRESYIPKTAETRARSMANLVTYGGGKKPRKTKKLFGPRQLAKMDIIEFATKVLHVSFEERPAQEVVLRSLYGLPLNAAQEGIYKKIMGLDEVFEPDVDKSEACWAIGARGGKSTLASIIVLFESICRADMWKRHLQPGEVGYCILMATREEQSKQIIGRNSARLLRDSTINYYIEDEFKTELVLTNGLRIMSIPCNSTAARGLPIFCLVFDEIAHYKLEGYKADKGIVDALKPRQMQFPGAKCLMISTPAAKQGVFWDTFAQGKKVSGRLTIQTSTRVLNPEIPQSAIDAEYERDPDNAEMELGAEFVEKLEGFFNSCIPALDACYNLPENEDVPYKGQYQYFAGIDQSGLTGRDRWGFAIAHKDFYDPSRKVYVDVYRQWPTGRLAEIMATIKHLCQLYAIRKVKGDRYAAGLIEQLLNEQGLELELRDTLASVYVDFKTLVIAGRLNLPDHFPLRTSLVRTQAFYGRSNALTIGHERSIHGHADLADAIVTACVDASKGIEYPTAPLATGGKSQSDGSEYDVLRWGL